MRPLQRRTIYKLALFIATGALLFMVAVSLPQAWSAFPSLCSLSRDLPPSAKATRCDFDGGNDYESVFEAIIPAEDVAIFQTNILRDLTNPKVVATPDGAEITSDDDKIITIRWHEGTMYVDYYKY